MTIALAGGAFIASSGCFYMILTYAVSYGINHAHVSSSTMLLGLMSGNLFMMPALAWFAVLSDRYGRIGIYMLGAAATGLVSFALFPAIETQSAFAIAAVLIAAMVSAAMMYGPQAALFAELFDQKIRYSGASLGYQIGSILGGGLAPLVATRTLFGVRLDDGHCRLYGCHVRGVPRLYCRARTTATRRRFTDSTYFPHPPRSLAVMR